ncbi:MAG: hypothetical protein KGL19_15940 [Bacteroidota bacterium]|nr:hypothetical protein [Bacteroidota bacterium]
MEHLPFYVYAVFALTFLLALFIFYKATNRSKIFLTVVSIWAALQAIISISGFYTVTQTFPPRFALLLIPPLVSIVVLFNSKKGKQFIDGMNIKTLTIFHVIRIPVELILFWLFINKAIPQLMTFEGRNFDIFSGLSAPIIFYFGFVKKKINASIIIIWNFICLALVLNIAINAILSVPGTLQRFAFDQPNIAIIHFPFILLPACLVPLVLFSHLASIRQLLFNKKI